MAGHTLPQLTPGKGSDRKGREERRMAERRHAVQCTPRTRCRKPGRVASRILATPARRAARATSPRRRCTAERKAIRCPTERLTRTGRDREAGFVLDLVGRVQAARARRENDAAREDQRDTCQRPTTGDRRQEAETQVTRRDLRMTPERHSATTCANDVRENRRKC